MENRKISLNQKLFDFWHIGPPYVAALGVVELKLLPLAVVKVDSEASEV